MKKKTKQFILDKFVEKWVKGNKEMLNDYTEICHDLLFFRAKWGIEMGFIFKNTEEIKGRELGKGAIEDIFNAQEYANKAQEYANKKFINPTP